MSDPNEARWIKTTANELNNILQVISESGDLLGKHLSGDEEGERYFQMLRESVVRAVTVSRELADRLSGVSDGQGSNGPASLASRSPLRPSSAAPETIRIHNPTGNRELVMIVDDEDFVTMLASRVLANEGYRVLTARDGFQALDYYRRLQSEIALVILDFTMPVMDGSDVFAELQSINPKVAVVLSSGFAEQDRLRSMLARGLRGFIPKPYSTQKLLDQVRQTLEALSSL